MGEHAESVEAEPLKIHRSIVCFEQPQPESYVCSAMNTRFVCFM